MKKARKFLLNTLILTATSLFLRTLGMGFSVYISNKIGAEGMGIYQLLLSIYSFGVTLSLAGVSLATTRLVTEQLTRSSAKLFKAPSSWERRRNRGWICFIWSRVSRTESGTVRKNTPFVTVKHLSAKELNKIEIPVLSLEEQRKIAETLSKVDKLIAFREQQLAKLDELVKARFVEMFGDEQAFNKEPLSQNVEEMFIGPFGSSLKNENFVSKENGYCMVYEQKHAIRKTMDVETRYIDKPKYEELKRFSIHGGDIIVSCRGTIGETYIVPLNAPLGIMHPSIMKIRVKDSIYDRVFFDFLLQEKLKQHEAQANGSGVKMAVTASALGKEEFIVPSIPFQNQFAAFVERVDQQKQTVQQSLEKLELMKKALMQEYFG